MAEPIPVIPLEAAQVQTAGLLGPLPDQEFAQPAHLVVLPGLLGQVHVGRVQEQVPGPFLLADVLGFAVGPFGVGLGLFGFTIGSLRVDLGFPSPVIGLHRKIGGNARAGQQGCGHGGYEAGHHRIAPAPAPGSFQRPCGSGQDRPPIEEPP